MILSHLIQHIVVLAPAIQHAQANLSHVLSHIPAAAPPPSPTPAAIPAPGGGTNAYEDLNVFAGSVQTFLGIIGGVVFLIGVSIAGIMRMVAFGSDRRIALSNMALTAAVVGLVILMMSYGLYNLISKAFPTH